MPSAPEERPRLLEVDLDGASVRCQVRSWTSRDPALERIGAWSGPALGLALLREAQVAGSELPFVVAAGECVRRGLPTAARATVMARAPLTGRVAEGQVGSDLGRRLARVADVLAIRGQTAEPGAVLVIDGNGVARVVSLPAIVGLDPGGAHASCVAEFGPCTTLRTGPGGEAGVRFAVLAAGDSPPSFVGRGGLGAALGATGLKAIVITAEPVESEDAPDLVQSLLASPRLVARGEGGTMELAHAFGVRGDLRARGHRSAIDADDARRLGDEAEDAKRERHGCKGCPTPCGWVFETQGARQGAKFSAVYALGANLGSEDLDSSLRLLAVCDRLGLDAKEAGAGLALLAEEQEQKGAAVWGDTAVFERWLEECVAGTGEGARLAQGAQALARSSGHEDQAYLAAGEAARPETNLAAVLGMVVGGRGAEPMRTFPFLVGDGAVRARIERLVAPLPLPVGAEDPRDPRGKGRLVWWHENLVTAVDAAGFCAFSAAGILADGACDLDELARWIAPLALMREPGDASAGERLLAMGEDLTQLHRVIDADLGVTPPAPPAWARESLAQAGMQDEYERYRGGGGERRGHLGAASVAAAAAPVPRAVGPGTVTFQGFGALGRALGGAVELELALPVNLLDVLRQLAQEHPDAARWLVVGSQPVAAVYRAGVRLQADAQVADGDRLDLVLAVAGG